MNATIYPWRSSLATAAGRGSVRQALAGKHIMVTGATGFVGKVWLALMLECVPQLRRVSVLARSIKGRSASQRLQTMLERSPAFRSWRQHTEMDIESLLATQLQVLSGTVCEPSCGLSSEALFGLRGVDALVNFAGLTDFEPDPAQALAVNVRGALHAADLVKALGNVPMLHVSTTFVAGSRSGAVPETLQVGLSPNGSEFDPEEELKRLSELCALHGSRKARVDAVTARAVQLGWPNIYTYSKGLSEHLLRQRLGDRVIFVRPSIVESALHYPFPGWNEGVNTSAPLVWLLSTAFRRFPARRQHRFDVVPVDAVARGICLVLAAAVRGEARGVYHLASSDSNPLTFERAVELTGLGVRQLHARPQASRWERHVLRHLDAVPIDRQAVWLDVATQRHWVGRCRQTLRRIELQGHLPAWLEGLLGAGRFDQQVQNLAKRLRKLERTLGRMQELLRVYKPFIYDHDHVFCTEAIRQASATLPLDERRDFAFDVQTIDWYRYWLEVQVPGLAQWSLPQMRGERVPQDPPPPPRLTALPPTSKALVPVNPKLEAYNVG